MNTFNATNPKHSEEYYKIKKEIEEEFPEWKIESINVNIMTSAHCAKLKRKVKHELS